MATGTRGATKSRATKGTAEPEHGVKMLAYVLKAEVPESRQIEDPFVTLYGEGLALEPELDPFRLLLLADESAAHGACLDAKADDTVGRGWTLEPTGEAKADPGDPSLEDPDVAPDESAATPAGGEPDATIEGPDVEAAVAELEQRLEALCPDYSFAELLWQAAWEVGAFGWSGWEMVNGNDGKLGAIYPMPGHTIRMTKDKDIFVQIVGGTTRYFVRFGSGKRIDAQTGKVLGAKDTRGKTNDPEGTIVATEVLLFRPYSSRNKNYPLPRWVSCIPAIAELVSIREFNVSFFGSGGVVDRAIHVKAGDETAAKTLAGEVKEQIDSAAGDAHITLVTGGDKDSALTVSFLTPVAGRRDGQFNTRRAELTDEVLMAHKVPGYRIAKAIVGSLGGAPSREMLHTYRTGTIEPIQDKLEHVLNATLFGPNGLSLEGYKWRLEDLDWDETELDLKIATGLVDSGIASPDEGREIMGLPATGDPKMALFYYKGQPIGEPRPMPTGPAFGASSSALAQVDAKLADIRARRAAAPSTNGHSTEPVPTTRV